jgi:Domain of unknown function (DUF4124)
MKWLALGALLIALPATAQMYKCVDARGVVTYSDKPSPGCKGGPVDIRPIPSLSGQAKPAPQSPNSSQQDADFRRRQIERERAEAAESAAQAQRCARARYEIGRLSAGTRVSRINDAGERIYLDDATRDARLAELKQQIRGCP